MIRKACLLFAAAVAALLLTGCASTPSALRDAPAESPAIAAVSARPDAYAGQRVRWGGTIAAVHNERSETRLAIVGRPLRDNGRPYSDAGSPGRFLALIPKFLDPAIYAQGRAVTVVGTLAGSEVREIGDYPYRYPVVRAASHHLWEPLPPPRPIGCGYGPWHDPFWHPWYGPVPWRHHPCY